MGRPEDGVGNLGIIATCRLCRKRTLGDSATRIPKVSERNGGPLHVSQLLEPIVLENALRSCSKLHPARPVLGLKVPITPSSRTEKIR